MKQIETAQIQSNVTSLRKPRKQRSDKKRAVNATVDVNLKDSIYRFAFVISKSVKEVCEFLVLHTLEDDEIIDSLSNYFRRNIKVNNTMYIGSLDNQKITRHVGESTERIFFKLKSDPHEKMYALSYALDCSVSRVASLLLYESITDTAFMKVHVEDYLDSQDKSKKQELKQLLKYIKTETSEEYTILELLSLLIDEPIVWKFPE